MESQKKQGVALKDVVPQVAACLGDKNKPPRKGTLRMARSILKVAKKRAGRNMGQLEDLVSAGILGLLEALKKRDPAFTREQFEAFAWSVARDTIRDYHRDDRNLQAFRGRNGRAVYDGREEPHPIHGREISLHQNKRTGDGEMGYLIDSLVDPSPGQHERLEYAERALTVQLQVKELSAREKAAAAYLAGGHETLQEAADAIGVSREGMRKIVQRTSKKLRKRLPN